MSIKIKKLPEGIRELALKEQIKQTLYFSKNSYLADAFRWAKTEQGIDFWSEINDGNYEVYYNKYGYGVEPLPKQESNDDKLIRRFTTGAVRSNSKGRIRPDWISPYFAQEVSKVLIDNENDFGGNNYLLGIPVLACLESLMRHTAELQEALLITKDKEESLKIARSVGFNIVSMIHSMILQEKGLYKEVFEKTELVTVKEAKKGSTYVKKEG